MIALTYLMPLFGIFMFFFVHQFWTMKLPVDVIHELIKVLQTKGKETQHCSSEKTVATVKKVIKYLGEDFEKDYKEFKKVSFWRRLIYPYVSPLHIIVTSLYILTFVVFLVCCIIDGPSGREWLVYHIVVTATAILINIYAASIVLFWLLILIAIAVVIAAIIAVIAVIIGLFILLLACFILLLPRIAMKKGSNELWKYLCRDGS